MKKKKFPDFIRLILSGTIIIHSINVLIFQISQSGRKLDKTRFKIYKWEYGDICYEVYGKGSPILLIHDLDPCFSGIEWDKIKSHLSENHRVYIIDLPGCGRSQKCNMTYTNFVFVKCLNDFVENIIKKKTDLLVSGYSSSFSVLASVYNPSNFGRIIAINPVSVDKLKETAYKATPIKKKLIELPVIGTLLYNIYARREAIKSRFVNQYYYNPSRIDEGLIDILYEGSHKGGYNKKFLYSSMVSGYLTADIQKAMQNMKSDISLIMGDHYPDRINTVNSYKRYNNTFKTVEISGTCKYPHMETPDRFIEVLDTL